MAVPPHPTTIVTPPGYDVAILIPNLALVPFAKFPDGQSSATPPHHSRVKA